MNEDNRIATLKYDLKCAKRVIEGQQRMIITLLNEAKLARRLMWLLVNAAGGSVVVSRLSEIIFEEKKVYLEKVSLSMYDGTKYNAKMRGE